MIQAERNGGCERHAFSLLLSSSRSRVCQYAGGGGDAVHWGVRMCVLGEKVRVEAAVRAGPETKPTKPGRKRSRRKRVGERVAGGVEGKRRGPTPPRQANSSLCSMHICWRAGITDHVKLTTVALGACASRGAGVEPPPRCAMEWKPHDGVLGERRWQKSWVVHRKTFVVAALAQKVGPSSDTHTHIATRPPRVASSRAS